MENIIKKAIEGGYLYVKDKTPQQIDWLIRTFKNREKEVTLDPIFWQALGKACGWGEKKIWLNPYTPKGRYIPNQMIDRCIQEAMNFHEINLTQGWNKAVEWLEELVIRDKKK